MEELKQATKSKLPAVEQAKNSALLFLEPDIYTARKEEVKEQGEHTEERSRLELTPISRNRKKPAYKY